MPELIPIKNIKVNHRQREDYGDLADLAKSFKEYGQLSPILIDDQNNLLAGGRRLAAAILAGWTEIKFERYGAVSPQRAREIELEENIRRKQLTWQEEQKAIAEIHELNAKKDSSWTVDKTAEMLGVTKRTIFRAKALAAAIETKPEIAEAETASGALLRLERLNQIERRKEEVKVAELAQKVGMTTTRTFARVNTYQGDALEYVSALPDNSVDCFFTNPPFGVNIEKLFKGNKKIYSDEPAQVYQMLDTLYREIFRALKSDRWFVTYWPTATIEVGKALLAECGFDFDPVPWVWYKPNKFVTAMGDPYSDVNIQYETFFLARKGRPKWLKIPLDNVIVYDTPSADRLHPLQMPPEAWQEVLQYVTQPGEFAVEPFSGSGSGAIACLRLGINYDGYELDPTYYERSQLWLSEEKLLLSKEG